MCLIDIYVFVIIVLGCIIALFRGRIKERDEHFKRHVDEDIAPGNIKIK